MNSPDAFSPVSTSSGITSLVCANPAKYLGSCSNARNTSKPARIPPGLTSTSPAGATFFLQFEVQIPGFNATLIVDTPVAAQDFPLPGNAVYEGVASVSGTFRYAAVTGTAWNEQAL